MKNAVIFLCLAMLAALPAAAQENGGEEAYYAIVPEFNAEGFSDFGEWLKENIEYPVGRNRLKTHGKVRINFNVNKNGAVRVVALVDNPDGLLSREVIKTVSDSPRWIPGKAADGIPVKVTMTVTVFFNGYSGQFSIGSLGPLDLV